MNKLILKVIFTILLLIAGIFIYINFYSNPDIVLQESGTGTINIDNQKNNTINQSNEIYIDSLDSGW